MEDKMTQIQYCSDLHLEFPANRAYILEHPIEAQAEVLVMAGDILTLSTLDRFDWFFDDISTKFKQVYWIAGNHEYYNSDIGNRSGSFEEKIRDNILFLNNRMVEIDGTGLFFTTLWSRLSEENQAYVTQSLNDFRLIKNRGKALSTSHYNAMHLENLQFLEKSLEEGPAKKVVVTHHVPTYHNYPVHYLGDPLNEAFATDLGELMKKHAPNYWIFGHHHFNPGPFKIGDTTLLTNQLGYVGMGEHRLYSPTAVLEL